MKTAMQELIEHIQINATKFSLMNTYNILKEIEPYLEKEKEQTIGLIQGFIHSKKVITPEEYFNKKYNQNK